MKTLFLIFCFFLGCDNQSTRRPVVTGSSVQNSLEEAQQETPETEPTLPSEFSHCTYFGQYLQAQAGKIYGRVDICKSSTTPTSLYVKFDRMDQTGPICLLPMTKNAQGVSDYIGEATCGIQLPYAFRTTIKINRPGQNAANTPFIALPFNSVLVFKEKNNTIGAIMNCLRASSTKKITIPGYPAGITEKEYLCKHVMEKNYLSHYQLIIF